MRFVVLVIPTLLLLVGAFGIISSWMVYYKYSQAFVRGVRVEADIERKYVSFDVDGSSEYMIKYQFSLPSKVVQAGATEVPKETWQALKKGDKVLLAYLPEEPRRAILPALGAPSLLLPVFATAISLVVAAFGALALLGSARKPPQADAA